MHLAQQHAHDRLARDVQDHVQEARLTLCQVVADERQQEARRSCRLAFTATLRTA